MRLVKGLIVSFKFKRGEKLTFDSRETSCLSRRVCDATATVWPFAEASVGCRGVGRESSVPVGSACVCMPVSDVD